MGINFPATPAIGEIYPTPALPGVPQWMWDGAAWNGVILDTTGYVLKSGDVMSGSLLPSVTGTLNLGSAALRWGTIYTSDLELSNGIGNWTIVEGQDDLYLYNNLRGKVYKFWLVEVPPEEAPAKAG